MTKLIVTPINVNSTGSYRQRRRFLKLIQRVRRAQEKNDPVEALTLMEEADELIKSHLRTDDDTSVEDALDEISATQFDQLLTQIAFEGIEAVPPKKSETSSSGLEEA